MTPSNPPSRGATGKLIALGLLLVGGLALFVNTELARDRHAAESRLQSELEAQARLAEAAVNERVGKVDTALIFLRRVAETSGLDEFVRVYGNLRETVLTEMAEGAIVTDASGRALLTNDRKPEKPLSSPIATSSCSCATALTCWLFRRRSSAHQRAACHRRGA